MGPRLSFVTLVVRDLAATRRFYIEGLAWPVELEAPGEVLMVRVADSVVLSFWQEDKAAVELGPIGRTSEALPFTLAHNVPRRTDVDAVVGQARAAGAQIITPPTERDWGGYSAYIGDPDGFRWEIAWNPGPIGQSVL